VGTLGAGYLLSVHTAQYLLYCMVAPPLILMGLPRSLLLGAESRPRLWLRRMANPVVALLVFNAVLFGSHVPAVVDGLRVSQVGSMMIDLAWLAGGLSLWWPVVAPTPEISRVTLPWKAGYLFLSTILPTIPAAFMIYADYPIYRLYELAPRVNDILSTTDQLVAGLLMKAGGDIISWIALLIVLVRWARSEAARDRMERNERAAAV